MPKYYDMDEVFFNSEEILHEIKKGKIFVYPTDTVYGIGCNAEIRECVRRIYDIKKREKHKPLSVIAPNEDWILNNFKVSKVILRLYLPGPYTLLLEKKDKRFLNHVSPNDQMGIRIPEHPFTLLVMKANIPFITTSANLSGEEAPASFEEINKYILEKADYVIKGPCYLGQPSTLVEVKEEIRRIER